MVVSSIKGNTGALLEVNCETDFVTKNDSFLALAQAAVDLVAEHNPADVAALSAMSYSQDGLARRWKTCARVWLARLART